jgi:hypothetical protein
LLRESLLEVVGFLDTNRDNLLLAWKMIRRLLACWLIILWQPFGSIYASSYLVVSQEERICLWYRKPDWSFPSLLGPSWMLPAKQANMFFVVVVVLLSIELLESPHVTRADSI